MSTSARAQVSEEEFLSLPESNGLIELVDGEVIVAPSPTLWHQRVLTRLVMQLVQWADTSPALLTVAQAPLDVRFARGRILQPDAMVFSPALDPNASTPIDQVPVICVEVLSQDRTYDRITKRFLYAEAGVEEYWLVDPAELIERRTGAGLNRVEEVTDVLRPGLLPGLELDVRGLFR